MLGERLSLVGGGPRWLNINAAVKIGGFEKPDEIYEGIRKHEIRVNENICNMDHPDAENSWIQIEPRSFIQWLEKRSKFSLDTISKKYDNIRQDNIKVQVKLGFVQQQMGILKTEIVRQQGMIERLIEMATARKVRRQRNGTRI